jgi:hypothetical protein
MSERSERIMGTACVESQAGAAAARGGGLSERSEAAA